MSFVRALVLLLGLLLGVVLGQFLPSGNGLNHVFGTVSLGLAGLLTGFLLSARIERRAYALIERFGKWYGSLAPRTVAAATVGAVVALLLSVLLNTLLASVPFYSWVWNLLVTLVLGAFFVVFAVRNADTFGAIAWTGQPRRKPGGKLLDTNIIIDGRILDLARAGFIEGELVVPAFVLRELQFLGDHAEPQRRARGKRGLNVLEELRQVTTLRVEDWDAPELSAVDDKLVRLARESGAKLLTNDANLSKIAKLHDIPVLSLHEAAQALRPQLQPGDPLTVNITRAGQQAGQGVAHLDDGTMIVVEDGAKYRNRRVRVIVVNNVQTNVGRMVFAKLDANPVDN
ncbi:PIN/TRAM domain-containing protein [Deinococcus maricopensis]|uniref:PilT protein domain protein n=1 Tax=Deinococcus maricopensis (strain DSM 21211 / LMG 22137 / NRRL B-23946 / LB-34) TaxID=709986 RepID=E8U7Y0_DEIML|nr:PIN domain-containing protein [Deinococcus maricopensis]ADV67169.1 PilT protein domain protein [Deinococcus maricopensis DSM 21211]